MQAILEFTFFRQTILLWPTALIVVKTNSSKMWTLFMTIRESALLGRTARYFPFYDTQLLMTISLRYLVVPVSFALFLLSCIGAFNLYLLDKRESEEGESAKSGPTTETRLIFLFPSFFLVHNFIYIFILRVMVKIWNTASGRLRTQMHSNQVESSWLWYFLSDQKVTTARKGPRYVKTEISQKKLWEPYHWQKKNWGYLFRILLPSCSILSRRSNWKSFWRRILNWNT